MLDKVAENPDREPNPCPNCGMNDRVDCGNLMQSDDGYDFDCAIGKEPCDNCVHVFCDDCKAEVAAAKIARERLVELRAQAKVLGEEQNAAAMRLGETEREAGRVKATIITYERLLTQSPWVFERIEDDGTVVLESAIRCFPKLMEVIEDEGWYHYSYPLVPGATTEHPPLVEVRVDDDDLRLYIRGPSAKAYLSTWGLTVDFMPIVEKADEYRTRLAAAEKIIKDFDVAVHSRDECTYSKFGTCPVCRTRYYVEDGERKSSFVDPGEFGEHYYLAAPDATSDCAHECGCWAGPSRSGGPVDPFGPCPKNPKP